MKENTATRPLVASRVADEAIADFLQAAEAGAAPSRTDFIREHYDVRSELESFFVVYDQLDCNNPIGDRDLGSFVEGQQLGRYKLVRPIGAGTFGTVWLGFDAQLKRPVAIKVPNQNRFSSQQQRELFLSEAQNVAQLAHPNIVPIHDVGETDGRDVYLVCRFVAGDDLASELQNRRFSFRESARCVAQIASALEYAHGRKLIHRDVKPSNILIDAVTGQAFITDFGLSSIGEVRSDSSISGTPAYMSPEQAAGDPLDRRSDIFSLGVVLFELLCGQRPFSGTGARAVMRSIRLDTTPLPRQLDCRIPAALETACLKSLAKTPDDRYDRSVELESDLNAYLDSTSTTGDDLPGTKEGRINTWRKHVVAIVGIPAIAACSWLAIAKSIPFSVEDSAAPTTLSAQTKSIDREIAEQVIEMGAISMSVTTRKIMK